MRHYIVRCLMAGLILAQPVLVFSDAEDSRVAVGLKGGTLGVGAEVFFKISDHFTARGGAHGFSYSLDGTTSDISYDFDLDLLNFPIILDWFPWQNGFHLSGGLIINESDYKATGESQGSYTIGDTTYTGAQIGTLNGTIEVNEFCPYAGFGFGGPFTGASNWSFSLDLGVMFQGKPDVELTATGPIAGTPGFESDIEQEEQDLEDRSDVFEFYPVVSLGIAYRF